MSLNDSGGSHRSVTHVSVLPTEIKCTFDIRKIFCSVDYANPYRYAFFLALFFPDRLSEIRKTVTKLMDIARVIKTRRTIHGNFSVSY